VELALIRAQAGLHKVARSRDTQNSSQMYLFLKLSSTDRLLGRVISHVDDYKSAMGDLEMGHHYSR
jgi:hypothetical protein